MTAFSTSIRTDHASKYLQQLCKHFAHKVVVDYSPVAGRVEFPPGRCVMRAEGGKLSFHCLAKEPRAVPVIQSILVQHIVKFAWREELTIDWSDGVPEAIDAELRAADFLPPRVTAEGPSASDHGQD